MELDRSADAPAEEEAPADPQAEAVRAALEKPFRPYLNRAFFWANVLVFAVGLYFAWRQKAAGDFLMPIKFRGGQFFLVNNPTVNRILDRSGSLSREDYRAGHHWRLLACAFVHVGLIHLAMNLFALRAVGADVELMFGRWGYLVIYLLATLGGSCYGLTSAAPTQKLSGASAAVCGLIAAAAVWLLLNRRYLPRKMVVRALVGVVLSAVLIGLISTASVVSGRAHIGGAVAGGVAALLLHHLRFGNTVVRAVALVLLVSLPFVCVWVLERSVSQVPELLKIRASLRPAASEAVAFYKANGDFNALLRKRPERRDEDEVRKALARVGELEEQFAAAARGLEGLRRLTPVVYEDERQAALAFVREHLQLAQEARRALREGLMHETLTRRYHELSEVQGRWLDATRASDKEEAQKQEVQK